LDRTARTRQPRQDNQEREAGTGKSERPTGWYSREGTETEQPEYNSKDRTAKTRQLDGARRLRERISGTGHSAKIGQPGWNNCTS
jgi:hypothetical protein